MAFEIHKNHLKNLPIFCLTGPTGVGKSDLAIQLANSFSCEIISVDSVMVYRHMDIGTAKPPQSILERIPHHLVNIRDPAEPYSAGEFFRDVQLKINIILKKQRIPLLVGGTMLYLKTLQNGLAELPNYTTHRDYLELRDRLQRTNLSQLYQQLQQYDPKIALRIHEHDTQRIHRALMIYYLIGKPLSTLQATSQQSFSYPIHWIGLYPTNREKLRKAITQRFQSMLDKGLIEEVEKLYSRSDLSFNLPACRAVGYRQIWQYLAGKTNFHDMKTQSIIATCQLAKRQLTWLRHWPNIKTFNADSLTRLEELKTFIDKQLG